MTDPSIRHTGPSLDHVGLFVPDLVAVTSFLAALGFATTPTAAQRQSEPNGTLTPSGTANRLAMLHQGYIEILTPVGDTALAVRMREAIGRRAGLHLVAFGCDDATAEHARLEAQGFAPLPLVRLARANAHGERARFEVVRIADGMMPEGRMQFCRHLTPEKVWMRPWIDQPNGVRTLDACLIETPSLAESSARFTRFLGVAPRVAHDGRSHRFDLAGAALVIRAAEVPGAGSTMPALVLGVDDPRRIEALLRRAGVRHARQDAGVVSADLRPLLDLDVAFASEGCQPSWLDDAAFGDAAALA